MSKKAIFTISIAAAIILLCIFVFSSSNPAEAPQRISFTEEPLQNTAIPQASVPSATPVPSSTASAAKETTITIDETGFSPKDVVIAKGTTVVFINNGQALHWPANDPRQSPAGVPGFEAEKGLSTGETFSRMFNDPGVWGFYDRLNDSAEGTITVK